jgi:choline dehydrogenase-like flavoprotein
MPELTEAQRATLRAVCDTYVPSLPRADDADGFWGRAASHLGVDQGLADVLAGLPADQSAGMAQLLDVLAEQGFLGASQASREQLLRNTAMASREAAGGVAALRGLTFLLTYAGVDPSTGRNPNWERLGYPGPPQVEPGPVEAVEPMAVDGDVTLDADVVVVGSGAGGGVIAGRLAEQGAKVVVLEAGIPFHEAQSPGLELWAWQNLYWRGGPTPTADGTITLQAGSALGGGTVINWTNCLRTYPWVRADWAAHGLEDVATPAFDAHLDAIWSRYGVRGDCSDLNRPQQAMERGAEKLGWAFARTNRNVDPERYRPESAGHMGFGDRSAAKLSTAKTFLLDAVRHGADVLTSVFVDRILVEGGRAAGVAGRHASGASVTVRAPQVVVAAGSLESPGLLLRSGIGGPAAGRFLRLHPATATFGFYEDDMQAWWGPPHAGIVTELHDTGEGYGCYLEGAQYTTGLAASAIPFTTAEDHKAMMSDFRHGATIVCHIRDRGHGKVTLDPNGMTQIAYGVTDPLDIEHTRLGMEGAIRLHEAAGAQRIAIFAPGAPTWKRGEDVEAFIARMRRQPVRAGGVTMFSAHQMGSCRMGADPAESVADPRGELHDTPGVWIGDASAFPTASGTNPMISTMALAHRTAAHLAQAAGVAAPSRQEALA